MDFFLPPPLTLFNTKERKHLIIRGIKEHIYSIFSFSQHGNSHFIKSIDAIPSETRGESLHCLGISHSFLGEKPLLAMCKPRNFALTTKKSTDCFTLKKMKPYEEVDSFLSSDYWFTLDAVVHLRLLPFRSGLWLRGTSPTTSSPTTQGSHHRMVVHRSYAI